MRCHFTSWGAMRCHYNSWGAKRRLQSTLIFLFSVQVLLPLMAGGALLTPGGMWSSGESGTGKMMGAGTFNRHEAGAFNGQEEDVFKFPEAGSEADLTACPQSCDPENQVIATEQSFLQTASGLAYMQYWFDDFNAPPGTGVIPTGGGLMDLRLSTSGIGVGAHILYFRFRDQLGKWSSLASQKFIKTDIRETGAFGLTLCEYWLDDDYAGSKREVPVTGSFLQLDALDLSDQSPGFHQLHMRFRDDAGRWSAVSSGSVTIFPPRTADLPRIVQYEYWFDGEYADRQTVGVSPGERFSVNSLPLSGLPEGLHRLSLRFRDDAGRYSAVISQNIYKVPQRPREEVAIKAYRFWFDEATDEVETIWLNQPATSFVLARDFDSFRFKEGDHFIHFQFLDERGEWSSVSSVDFKTNFPGTIYGRITDRNSGLPLSGVIVKTWDYSSEPSGEDGSYTLKVPLGFGYTIGAYSPRCITSFISGVDLTSLQPEVRLDIEMDATALQYEVTRILPDPNPLVSSGPQGSLLHRYYKVVNKSDGSPLPYVPVEVIGCDFSKTVKSDERGIVDISISCNQIGTGLPGAQQSFTIVSVNGESMDSPIEFFCRVDHREFGSSFASSSFYKGGISQVTAEYESGLNASLNVESRTTPVGLELHRQSYKGGGLSFGVGAALAVQFSDVQFGFDAGGSAEILGFMQSEDHYLFPHTGYSEWDAVAQYILLANSCFDELDISMIRFLTKCQEFFDNQSSLDNAYLGDSKAMGIKGGGSASAMAGMFENAETYLANLNVSGDVGLEGIGLYELRYDRKNGETIQGIELSGKAEMGAAGGLKYVIPPVLKGTQELPDLYAVNNEDESHGFRVEVIRNQVTKEFKAFNLYLMKRSTTQEKGFENIVCYTITGQDAPDLLMEISDNIKHLISLSSEITAGLPVRFKLDNNSFLDIIIALFMKVNDLQRNWQSLQDLDVSYYKLRKEIDGVKTNIPFKLDIGLDVLVNVSFNFGVEKGFEEGRYEVTEYGKYYLEKHLPLYKNTTAIPKVDMTYEEKIQEILDQIPSWIRKSMGVIKFITRMDLKSTSQGQNMVYSIGDNGSAIEIPEMAFPPIDTISVTSWGWYGDSVSLKSVNMKSPGKQVYAINRQRAEDSYGMKFGIGGFYQFEPYGMELVEPSVLTLEYDDEEITGFDESRLGMYWEDKENKKWIYAGGVVDTERNTVTASITKLGVYTLAPAMPYGEFGLKALPDSIYADGLSVTSVVSDSIFNNDHTLLADGAMFTIGLSYGSVVNSDADPQTEGIQLPLQGGKLSFQIRAHDLASIAQVRVASIKGSAFGSTRITYFDTIPPSMPHILSGLLEGDQASLVWKANPERDVAGYVIYYDTDTILPYNGVHTVYGEPSPIVLGIDTMRSISGLLGDSAYFFAVSAYDVSGNESRRSPFISVRKDTTGTSVFYALKAGWNILSFDHLPANKDLRVIFETLIKDGSLLKIQDEAGNTLEDFGAFGSWVNNIGELSLKEGYKVKVNRDCQLQFKGVAPSLPVEIPLKAGWNIIGYPRLVAANAKEVVQALIDRRTLVKVQDEKGNAIEDWGLLGGWQNNIGNFERGKGYKVKVTSEDTLIISGSYSKAAVTANTDRIPPQYFIPVTHNNGVDHMNINLVELPGNWLQPGDELGVFDRELCVGAVTLITRHLSARLVSIPVSAADKSGIAGFNDGHPISLKLWKASTGEIVVLEPDILQGSSVFRKNESTFASLAKYGTTGSGRIEKERAEKFTLYPNPTAGKFYLTTTGTTLQGVTLQLLNGAGQLLREELMEERTVEVDLTGCARGVYYLKIKGEDETQVKKIVLQ